jgi:hypothetical protein
VAARPLAAALLLTLALPAAASAAPRLRVDRRCYTVGDPVRVGGSGFPANSGVGLKLGTRDYGSAVTDGTGRLRASPGIAPAISNPFQRFTLTAQGAGGVTASTHMTISQLAVKITPGRVSAPTQTVTFRARGFDAGKALYVHYITPNRHVLKPRRLGHLNGPCGTLTVHAPLIPGAAPPSGRWRLRFDSFRRYTQRTRPQVRLTVRVG